MKCRFASCGRLPSLPGKEAAAQPEMGFRGWVILAEARRPKADHLATFDETVAGLAAEAWLVGA